jgi:fibronectin type 3 domain-containing protein
MVIRVQASESSFRGDWVEGGIDDVVVSYLVCSGGAPEPVDDLTADLLQEDIVLLWTEPASEGGVDRYVVYRSDDPAVEGDSLAGTGGQAYTDAGAAGNAGVNYYYSVKAVNGGGLKSEHSNRVGEFDRQLSTAP